MAKDKREKELLKVLQRIAVGIDRIGAALAVHVADEVKHEAQGGAEISDATQKDLFTAESLRHKALQALRRSYAG